MTNFGELKSKLLIKLTESYTNKNNNEVKDLVNKLKTNKNLSEMYMFYEGLETLNISNRDKAKLYVESIEPILIEKINGLKKEMKNFGKSLKDVVTENDNTLYNDLDILSEETNIHNVAKKIDARENLINHLIKEKKKEVHEKPSVQIENHSLLNAVLVNNFNIKYADFLNEDQKETFTKIVSMTESELETETHKIKSEINHKIESLLKESTDGTINEKLNNENELLKKKNEEINTIKSNLQKLFS